MPQVKVQFADADSVPTALKSHVGADNSISVWVGDNVAAETNPALEAKRTEILGEKKAISDKYDALLKSSGDTNREVLELRQQVASGNHMSAEDVELVNTIKAARPNVKAKDLKTELEEVPALRTKVAEIQQKDENSRLFKASGFKNETVFNDLISNKAKNPNVEKTYIQSETVDGKEIDVAYVDVKGDDGKVTKQKLTEYVAKNNDWQPYTSMLGTAPEQKQDWLPQVPTGSGTNEGAGDPVDDYISKHNKAVETAGNPMLKQTSSNTMTGERAVNQN